MITFYRCLLCASIVSKWDIQDGDGCSKCGSLKMSLTNLSWFEKLVQILKHPKVWDWGEDPEILKAEFPGDRDD